VLVITVGKFTSKSPYQTTTTKILSSASTPIHFQTSNPIRRSTLKHAIEAIIA